MSTRILVVDDHGTLRKNLADFLREQDSIDEVIEAANGAEALQYLQTESFDVVVTDLVMPMMDGYMLLEHIRQLHLSPSPKIIVISALARDGFVTHAIDLGATFFMVKPFEPVHLLGHIREMLAGNTNIIMPPPTAFPRLNTQTTDERISSLLLSLGVPAHIKGYQFLRSAIKMVMDEPDLINRITKELYPTIARQFNTSASKVERAIRHAIEVAWSRGRLEALNRIFGCRVCTPEDRPTNGEFIAMIADKLRMERSA